MPSSVSVLRRVAGLIVLAVRQRPGVTGFRFSAAANFDSPFIAFQTVPSYGFRSPGAQTSVAPIGSPHRGSCVFAFSPSDYSSSVPAVRDDVPFYVRIEPRLQGGAFGTPEPMQIILPYSPVPNPPVIIRGVAPAGLGYTGGVVTGALEICLPGLCTDFVVRNQSTGSQLFLSFDRGVSTGPGGPEYQVGPGGEFSTDYANASRVFLRGGTGGSADVEAIFTRKTQPLNL
jgi:hypothetical protein